MNSANLAALFQENMTTVKVVFDTSDFEDHKEDLEYLEGGRKYTYKIHKGMTLSIGDWVVVPARGDLNIVRVVEIDDEPDLDYDSNTIKYQWVIQRIDLDSYYELMEGEEKFKKMLLNVKKNQVRKDIENMLVEKYGDAILESPEVKFLKSM